MRVVAIIPAHLASVRFPRKVLFQICGLPMIEHVRRRAMLCAGLDDVRVATCDREIADTVTGAGGSVVMTSNRHQNGTSRISEAAAGIDCTHVVLLQGDEPLLLPAHVEAMLRRIESDPASDAWNITGPLKEASELDRHSFVKCAVAPDERILLCFRRSPFFSEFETQKRFVRKILGIIAYRRDFLLSLPKLPVSRIEAAESIEQMRIVENGHSLISVPVDRSLPSVNEPHEADLVVEEAMRDPVQKALLSSIGGSPERPNG